MAVTTLTERYAVNLQGALSRFDRIIITGTLQSACYVDGMTGFLYAHDIRICAAGSHSGSDPGGMRAGGH